jgi:eukaryotic-like serine/threonine-protein kinase
MTSQRARYYQATMAIAAIVPLLFAGCESSNNELGAATPPSELPKLVKVSQKSLTVGFAGELMRSELKVKPFRITKYPITREEFERCEDAGGCVKSKEDACRDEAKERLGGRRIDRATSPQTCVTVREAQSFCKWIGGRLPSLPEWMLAARGPSPRRYAWGDQAPTCDQHARAADVQGAFVNDAAAQEAGCVPANEASLRVGEF